MNESACHCSLNTLGDRAPDTSASAPASSCSCTSSSLVASYTISASRKSTICCCPPIAFPTTLAIATISLAASGAAANFDDNKFHTCNCFALMALSKSLPFSCFALISSSIACSSWRRAFSSASNADFTLSLPVVVEDAVNFRFLALDRCCCC